MSMDVSSSLINFCRSGNLEEVRSILSQCSLSDYPAWSEGYFPLCEALKYKQVEVTKFLLQNEAKVNMMTKGRSNSYTPLHHAVYIESLEIINILLDKEANINATDRNKKTPLHLAVGCRKEDIVKLLVRRGADVGLADKHGYTSLHLAAKNGNVKIVQHLINSEANINCMCKSYTALYFAIESSNLDIVKLLLENIAMNDLNYTANFTLLQLAIHQENVEILKLLFKHVHKVGKNNDAGLRVLHKTAEEDKTRFIEISWNKGYSVDVPVKSEIPSLRTAAGATTTVHKIVKSNDDTTLKFFLDQRSNVNANYLSLPTTLQPDLQSPVQEGIANIVDPLCNSSHNQNRNDGDLKLRFPILDQGEKQISSKNTSYLQSPHIYLTNGYTNVENIGKRCTNLKDVNTLLHTALIMKQTEMVKVLLNHGFDSNANNEFGRKPLFYAYKYNDSEMCKYLLLHGACINSKINQDLNLLHMAVENRDEEFVKFLLDQRVDVNATTNNHSTSLHIASRRGCERIVKLLLKHNADVHMKDNKDFTALHEASKEGNEKIVKLLLRKGSFVNAVTNCMSTSLHFAAQYSRGTVIQRLLKYGADVNLKDSKNKTALCYAAEIGDTFAVRLFLNKNPDFNNKNHKLAFCLAVLGNLLEHSNIVAIFVFRGFTLNSQDFYDFQIPEPLLSRYISDYNREEYVNIMKGLLKCEPSINAFFEYQVLRNSVEKGFLKVFKDLLRFDVNINSLLEEYCTLLHIAVINGQLGVAEQLLKCGANVNAIDIRGRTPLHNSVLNNFANVVAVLIKYKVDLEARDEDGKTALHLAADGKEHIARLLLNAGANINSISNNESRPLHVAAERGHKILVELLLDYDAEINVKNRSHETPLDLAVYWQKTEIVTVLLENGAIYNIFSIPTGNRDTIELMMMHLIKLQEICIGNDEINFGQQYNDFRSSCKEEIQRMVLKRVGINVLLYDILAQEDCTIEVYTRNKSIIQFFDSAEYKTLFPIYANVLRIRVNKAIRKNQLVESSAISLERMLEIKIPYLVIQKLFSYVNNTDLRNLIHAARTMNSDK